MAIDYTKCKCWIRPFDHPKGCYEYCTGKILKYAKPEELIEYFQFPVGLAEKLFELSSDDRLTLLPEFTAHLSADESNMVNSLFKNISPQGWSWIEEELKNKIEEEQGVPA
jgi:hypothetical protein